MALRVVRRSAAGVLRGVRARACEPRDVPACPPRLPAGCEPRDVPACPPCAPAAQPACRARPPSVRRAERRVCCAPPQGARPPCTPRDPPCSLNCEHLQEKVRQKSFCRGRVDVSTSSTMKTCDCGELDPVARRIMLAKRVRQAEYEREVVVRASKRCFEPAPPVPGFSLGAERECARATDGCTYTMRAVHAPRTRCGPGRTPPPPRCVELVPDDGCRIRGDSHLDPCAHRPRVMIEIDRSVNTDISLKRPSADHSPSKPMPGPGSGPRPCPVGKARVVPKWCADPPRPAPSPPCCRRPSLVERLRARSASCPPDPRCKRRLHTTSVVLGKTSKPVPSNSSGLDAILQNKKNLKEAGIGRFVKDECGQAAPSRQRAPAGKLELRLPPGTERVAVHVSLHGSTPSTCATTSPPVTSSATSCIEPPSNSCNKLRETCEKQNSWLSIKNIKKNISGCRLEEESPMTRVPAAGRCAGPRRPAIAPRCGPAAPPEPAAPRRCSSTSAYIANTVIVDSF